MLNSLAVVLEQPERISLTRLALDGPAAGDVVVETEWSGISAGTERLLFTGRMPPFPGMRYPLVPGYETVGVVVEAGPEAALEIGDRVFVPGARCFGPVLGLHGGAASRLVTPASRVLRVAASLGESATLLALAATAFHALAGSTPGGPILIVGHGVLGRLLARLAVLSGAEAPVVWEKNRARAGGAAGYEVTSSDDDQRRDYATIIEASGDGAILDSLLQRLGPGGEIVLAGFYDRLSFGFPPAFMREARIRVSATWREGDLSEVLKLAETARLSLEGLVTHRLPAFEARSAYSIAFDDPSCLKMVLDWRTVA